MKKMLFITLIAVMVLSGCADISGKKETISDYFPIKYNSYYEYGGEGSEMAQQNIYVSYAGENRIQRITSSGGYKLTEVLEFADDELRYIGGYGHYVFTDVSGLPAFENAVILKEPFKKGSKWLRDSFTETEITDMAAKITTPYGAFTAMEVTSTTRRPASGQMGESNYFLKEYYVKGIGLVKTDTYPIDATTPLVTMDLEKITEKTSLQLPINIFYYGELYIEPEQHIITVVTNMDFISCLEAEMKKPEDSSLNPILTPNAKINRLEYVPANPEQGDSIEHVSIDISHDFLDELAASNEEEPIDETAVLNGIAYTLGNLYNVNSIEILIDGKNYDSGQIRFETGEYMQIE